LGLGQIGEFSFVLAALGIQRKLIPPEISAVLLAAALVTILLTPFLFGAAPGVYAGLNRVGWLSRLLNRPPSGVPAKAPEPEPARVLVLGGGRVGGYVSTALREAGVPQLVVDFDGRSARRECTPGVPVLYGDATSEVVLEQARPEKAELAVVALPEAATTEIAVRLLKRLAPGLPIVARVHRAADISRMRDAGADGVIQAEFEAGVEMIRQALDRLGFPDPQVDAYLERVREERYRQG
ncbi:MAG TPA: NAD-binding protein, partial [Armatimonadota bacterium]|nr:NAD-binding protein [Armatimonadota bacterium]